MPFFAIFVAIPFLEIMLFMLVGDSIGLMTTLLLALLTAIIGGAIVQRQGLHTLAHMRQAMNRGQLPLNDLFDGMCLIAAGAMLITPGFLTDTLGFLLLVPPVRAGLRGILKRYTQWEEITPDQPAGFRQTHQGPHYDARGDIIDVDYETISEREPPQK